MKYKNLRITILLLMVFLANAGESLSGERIQIIIDGVGVGGVGVGFYVKTGPDEDDWDYEQLETKPDGSTESNFISHPSATFWVALLDPVQSLHTTAIYRQEIYPGLEAVWIEYNHSSFQLDIYYGMECYSIWQFTKNRESALSIKDFYDF